MTEILVTKTAGGALAPADQEAADYIARLKLGAVVKVKATRMRNPRFHRKFFAMLDVGFDAWEPPEKEFRGLPVEKNKERFRKDCIIAAGFYDQVANIKGEVRAEAKSISFGSMSDDEFEQVYSAVANVILSRILTRYTRTDLDNVVEQILRFT